MWVIGPSSIPAFVLMAFDPSATAGKVPVLLASGYGDVGSPSPSGIGFPTPTSIGTVLGIPLVVSAAAPGIGSLGDVSLVNLADYMTFWHTLTPDVAESIHYDFADGNTVIRLQHRMAGATILNLPLIDPNGGAFTMSSTVILD